MNFFRAFLTGGREDMVRRRAGVPDGVSEANEFSDKYARPTCLIAKSRDISSDYLSAHSVPDSDPREVHGDLLSSTRL